MVKSKFFFHSSHLKICLLLIFALLLNIALPKQYVSAETSLNVVLFDNAKVTGTLLASSSEYKAIELWHYPENYWKGNVIPEPLYDSEMKNNWNKPEYLAKKLIDKGITVDFELSIPDVVQKYIKDGGKVDVVVKTSNGMNPDQLFQTKAPYNTTYTIDSNSININCYPKLTCTQDDYDLYVSGLHETIPIVDQDYGRNIYSIFDADTDKHIGMAYSTVTDEEGKVPYTLIKNSRGYFDSGRIINVSDGTGTVHKLDSGTIKIGLNTFADAGAVGLMFAYPLKVEFYAKADGATAHIRYYQTNGTHINGYDSDQDIKYNGTYKFEPDSLSGWDYKGYKVGYDKEPSGSIASGGIVSGTNDGKLFKKDLYIYYYFDINVPTGGSSGSSDLNPNASGVIKADDRDSEKFDISQGIPTTEDLYTNVFAKNYLYNSKFKENTGVKSYNVTVSKTYNLSWQEDHGANVTTTTKDSKGVSHTTTQWVPKWETMSDSQTVSNTYTILREYSYWTIDNLEVYGIDRTEVNNYALPSEAITITPKNYSFPSLDTWHSDSVSDHIKEPTISNVTLSSQSINGGKSKPSVPSEDWLSNAENAVKQIQVKNDRLVFNNTTVMSDGLVSKDSYDPISIPANQNIGKDVLYRSGLTIDATKENRTCPSSGTIHYRLSEKSITSKTGEISKLFNVNSVKIHTPVVCSAGVWSDTGFNQEINPDNSRASVILDRPSKIQLSTYGQHNSILGYGNRDYEKYTKDKQVRFPFDVYMNTTYRQDGKYLKANTWCSIPMNKDTIDIYVPTWVDEGNYNIDYREIAINAPDYSRTEDRANFSINNYVATRSIPVRVIGRVFGFRITDITDRDWNQVFRAGEHTTKHSNNYYYVGTNNENGNSRGINSKFTLPILNGSHPNYKNYGAVKTGYKFKFELQTIGNYFNDFDAIDITPTFYYVSNKGKNVQAVDLYYDERFNDKQNNLVKVENTGRNRQNTKYIKLDNVYRNVPDSELTDTSRILGLSKTVFGGQNNKLGWFDWICLSKGLRTFIGDTSNLPAGVNSDRVKKSNQKWYGEYYLPNTVFACAKGTDVAEYGRTHYGIDSKSPIWLKNGYIVINFNIQTVKNKDFSKPVLSYWNAPNCNMWQMEGYSYTKTDYYGITYNLHSGDTIFYYVDKKASDDYQSGGTH